jgi:hypothetical protein
MNNLQHSVRNVLTDGLRVVLYSPEATTRALYCNIKFLPTPSGGVRYCAPRSPSTSIFVWICVRKFAPSVFGHHTGIITERCLGNSSVYVTEALREAVIHFKLPHAFRNKG